MFSWRYRAYTIASTLGFAGVGFLSVYLLLNRSFSPAWPYFVAIIVAGFLNQAFLVWLMPKVINK